MNNNEKKLLVGTLVYIRRVINGVQEIVLAIKGATPNAVKRGLAGKRNTYGGVEEDEDISIAHCGSRELFEESGVRVNPESLQKIAVITFRNSWGDFECHYFVVDNQKADPRATFEMPDPQWFPADKLPLEDMMESDTLLLPRLLAPNPRDRKFLMGEIWHDEKMHIVKHTVVEVEKLP